MNDSLSILKNSKGLFGFVCFRNSRALLVILMNYHVTCCVPRARDAEMSIKLNAQDKFAETYDIHAARPSHATPRPCPRFRVMLWYLQSNMLVIVVRI